MIKSVLRGTSAITAVALLGATPAFAQDAADDEAGDVGDVIIVTGSRISNPNLELAAPVNVTTSDELDLQQTNVAEEVLREIPGVVPSIGSAVNNGNGGASYVNLRGLGSYRNIVLLDGERIVPADIGGRVDLNNIPLALIERVDVLTGGASATYGADAITGVVNFVLNDDFEGLELNAGYQITEEGDGGTFRVDLTTGAAFDDGRGNVILGLGYQQSDPVYQGARPFSLFNIGSFTGAGSGSGTSVPSRLSVPGSGTLQVAPDGESLIGTYAPFNFNPYNIFNTPFERFNMFGSGRYEVTDGIEVYTRGMFSKQTVSTIIAPSGSFGIGIDLPLSNPFLTDGIRNQLCSGFEISAADCSAAALATDPNDPAYQTVRTSLFRRAVEVGPRISDYTTTLFDYRLGLRGDVTDTIRFDVSSSYGESENVETIQNYLLNSRIRQSVQATSATTCVDPSNGCVPINWFTPQQTTFTPEQIDFLSDSSQVTNKSSLVQARAGLSGDFGWTLPWASDAVAFAVGAEYREYKASQVSDSLAKAGDLGGAGGAAPDINGGYKVQEIYGEVLIPLVQDRPFFEELTINAGIRRSHYEVDAPGTPTYNTTTWTIGGSWAPIPDVKFRGNFSRAVRAPNIDELFSPVNTNLTNLSDDPCASIDDAGNRIRPGPTGVLRDVCIAQGANAGNVDTINQPIAGQVNYTGGGNLNLGPEKSNSYTIGVVLQPQAVPGLALTVDYYNIDVKDYISFPTPGDAISACFDDLSTSNPACLSIRRDPITGGLSGEAATTPGLFLAQTNLGRIKTAGVDFTLNYKRDIGFADLMLAIVGNWTDNSTFQSSPTATALDCVGLYSENCSSLQPEWQWSARTTLVFGDIDLSLLWRHIDSFTYEFAGDAFSGTLDESAGPVAGKSVDFNSIKAYDYFDLTTRFNATENMTFTFSIQNLFNKKPPILGSDIGPTAYNSGNTYPSTYDTLGRRFAVAAKLRF
jgi:outer membrane receptor protein involved in Fe transport